MDKYFTEFPSLVPWKLHRRLRLTCSTSTAERKDNNLAVHCMITGCTWEIRMSSMKRAVPRIAAQIDIFYDVARCALI